VTIDVSVESISGLEEYARVPIAFEVRRVLDVRVEDSGLKRFVFSERIVNIPYVKDYDSLDGHGPTCWPRRIDVSNWGLFVARVEGERVGGAVVAFDTVGLTMLDGRRDLAVLWDIRVSPQTRKKGVGSALFHATEAWAVERGCRQLKIETQNINVPACRFYARQGCVLGAVHRFAYPELPDEVQLLWYKQLTQ
jgi:GNAT superfamily N-acetyltransferase